MNNTYMYCLTISVTIWKEKRNEYSAAPSKDLITEISNVDG